ncbi:hypothetical protein Csa_022894, partial [Cucumis sativus]
MTILKAHKDPNNSSSVRVVISCASSMTITFISNFLGIDRNTFLTSLDFGVPSPKLKESFAISRTLTLYSVMVSSSIIFK